ncbi:hypothetical protein V6N12_027581 [Hibiscus sabdariffa]|uniref:Uncharacterized protein n=1 Tax=Hibiscus sabdariffa TaxID=183260 RepID=A0ABR2F3A8_9ROSI
MVSNNMEGPSWEESVALLNNPLSVKDVITERNCIVDSEEKSFFSELVKSRGKKKWEKVAADTFKSSLVPILPASGSVPSSSDISLDESTYEAPHSPSLGHDAGITSSATVGSASTQNEAVGEHYNALVQDREAPSHIGNLNHDGISSRLHESLQELSIPEHKSQQELPLLAEGPNDSHLVVPIPAAFASDPVPNPSNQFNRQEFDVSAMHPSDSQPRLPLSTAEPMLNSSNQLHQQGQMQSGEWQ